MRKYLLPGFLLISDILIIIAAAIMSVYIRFEGADVDHYLPVIVAHLPFLIVDFLLFFLFFELYRRVWRYAGIRELLAVAGAALCGTAAFYAGHNLLDGVYIPRTLYVLIFFIVLAGTGISRLALRFLITLSNRENKTSEAIPVLIIGAGDAGNLMARDIKQYHANDRHIVGFIDDDPSKLHNLAFGIKVIGGRQAIAGAVEKYGVKEIIIAMPSLTPREIAAIVDLCSQTKCITKIVPGVYSLLEQNVNMNTLRPVGVEDLLERDPVVLDVEKIAGYLKGKCVLVTGAGGSIGSELCRQVMQMRPSLDNVELLLAQGANIYAYDPVGIENFKKKYPEGKIGRGSITYVKRAEEALRAANICFIFTEWQDIKDITPDTYKKLMKPALVYDGRNIHSLQSMKDAGVEYYSIGR